MIVIAHRGDNEYHSENTLKAFESAVRGGADMIEFDIQFSKDREIIVFHDSYLDRITGKIGLVKNCNLETLQTYQVPTLLEVLTQLRGSIKLYIELKGMYDPFLVKKTIEYLREGIEYYNWNTSQFYLASFNWKYYTELLLYRKYYSIGFITCNNFIDNSRIKKADFISISSDVLSQDFLRMLRTYGIQVYVYTVNYLSNLIEVINMGVDGIITDYPSKTLRLINNNVLMNIDK